MEKVKVQVPASTSNLGPGFDCLGVALAWHNCITVARVREGAALLPIVDKTAQLFFEHARIRPFLFSARIDDKVPRSRGLGSSATAYVGVLYGLNELSGRPVSIQQMFELAATLEGHPDNVAPACFGGFTVIPPSAGGLERVVQRFEVSPELRFILLVPDYKVQTSRARQVLPAKVSRPAAVENVASACSITAAFASAEYQRLRGAFIDHLHQPFRKKLNPLLQRVVAAAEQAGALGAYLSGSGSTICAITLQHERRVAAAMNRAGGASARVVITKADNHGARVRHSSSATPHS